MRVLTSISHSLIFPKASENVKQNCDIEAHL